MKKALRNGIISGLILSAALIVADMAKAPSLVTQAQQAQEKTVMIYVTSVEKVMTLEFTPGGIEISVATRTVTHGGAGVYVNDNGTVLTVDHLFESATKSSTITVVGYNGQNYVGRVKDRSKRIDLALVETNEIGNEYAKLENPWHLKVGQDILVCGNPFFLEWTVTTGIISGLYRDGMVYNEVQLSAPINPGNSGGPVFNNTGNLVGIVSNGILDGNCCGFAVSIGQIREFLVKNKVWFR